MAQPICPRVAYLGGGEGGGEEEACEGEGDEKARRQCVSGPCATHASPQLAVAKAMRNLFLFNFPERLKLLRQVLYGLSNHKTLLYFLLLPQLTVGCTAFITKLPNVNIFFGGG